MTKRPQLGFIGAGVVGKALAMSLSRAGYVVVAVASRRISAAQDLAQAVAAQVLAGPQGVADAADLVFITTPDGAIREVVNSVFWRPGQMVVHCSGADSADALADARVQGAEVGVLHPLQTFANDQRALENLPGSYFAVEAEGRLRDVLFDIVDALQGKVIPMSAEHKALYHLSAVIASNYLVTLAAVASSLWEAFGIDQKEALDALLPLMRGTLHNIEHLGLPDGLTGPIARGDVATVKKHLAALESGAPEYAGFYRELAQQTIPLALAKGALSEENVEALRQLLMDRITHQEFSPILAAAARRSI